MNLVEEDEDDTPLETERNLGVSARYSLISKRMIDQFFTEVEGPDRDWGLDDYKDLGIDELET
jgi:hypothetical protein